MFLRAFVFKKNSYFEHMLNIVNSNKQTNKFGVMENITVGLKQEIRPTSQILNDWHTRTGSVSFTHTAREPVIDETSSAFPHFPESPTFAPFSGTGKPAEQFCQWWKTRVIWFSSSGRSTPTERKASRQAFIFLNLPSWLSKRTF